MKGRRSPVEHFLDELGAADAYAGVGVQSIAARSGRDLQAYRGSAWLSCAPHRG
ncbi:hypothetical protein [Aromatoleum buckelii]|uniref:Transposase n=1 Tax=Aromatoleum buckelii TaxID=200254 RepID=A0ABX1MW28_9RHOO|nr:hypothetical protein [Aromatoleum buckelii]MCK0511002.1 hypothetical protein [Aromatoleum buckelii]